MRDLVQHQHRLVAYLGFGLRDSKVCVCVCVCVCACFCLGEGGPAAGITYVTNS